MTRLCDFCLQDIRKFFSGAAANQNKQKEPSSRPSSVNTAAKSVVTVGDTKPKKSTQLKSEAKAESKTARVKPSNSASTGTDDVCIIDSESESEDFSSKQTAKNVNNNDIKANKRSKVKSSKTKESTSTVSVSDQQHSSEGDKQHLSVSKNKVSDTTGKKARSKKVKDEAAGSTTAVKSDDVCQQVTLCYCYFVPVLSQ